MNTLYFIVLCAMLQLSSITQVSGMSFALGNPFICPSGSRLAPDGDCVPLGRDLPSGGCTINGGCPPNSQDISSGGCSQPGGCKPKPLELRNGGCTQIGGCGHNSQDVLSEGCQDGSCAPLLQESAVLSCPAGHLRTQDGRCAPNYRLMSNSVGQITYSERCPAGSVPTPEGRCLVSKMRDSVRQCPPGYTHRPGRNCVRILMDYPSGGCPPGSMQTYAGKCMPMQSMNSPVNRIVYNSGGCPSGKCVAKFGNPGSECTQSGGCGQKYPDTLPGSCPPGSQVFPDGRCVPDSDYLNSSVNRVTYSCPAGTKSTQDGRCVSLYQEPFYGGCPAGSSRNQEGRCAPKLRFILKGGCSDGQCSA